MKKTLKGVFLFVVMAVMLLAMTGCGENNKLVATKEGEESGFGKYKETIEVTFKDKKADQITMTRELEDQDKADSISKALEYLGADAFNGMDVKVDGKKVIMTLNAKDFLGDDVKDEDLSRDSIKKELEDDGYKVK